MDKFNVVIMAEIQVQIEAETPEDALKQTYARDFCGDIYSDGKQLEWFLCSEGTAFVFDENGNEIDLKEE